LRLKGQPFNPNLKLLVVLEIWWHAISRLRAS
jgi:hypothetical protein